MEGKPLCYVKESNVQQDEMNFCAIEEPTYEYIPSKQIHGHTHTLSLARAHTHSKHKHSSTQTVSTQYIHSTCARRKHTHTKHTHNRLLVMLA